ncbi:MAG: acyl-CoA synthetase [Planctomycetes bacterium]|nr:acyl-CoA synthetase [Planctomycetota bacterium]
MYEHFSSGLNKCPANYQSLTPLSFLQRSAQVYSNKTAVIHGHQQFTYKQFETRCRRFASSLAALGVRRGSTVTVMAPNIPAHLEAHYAVPMSGAVLNSVNTRLEAAGLAYILDHAETDVLMVDSEYAPVMKKALELSGRDCLVVDIVDALGPPNEPIGSTSYQELLDQGDAQYQGEEVPDEWDAISLNYTSGTTGEPKGVVYNHRGVYLNALGNLLTWQMPKHATYLWTLPMFHCNGWCFPWSTVAMGATNVCLRKVDPDLITRLMAEHQVTHFCGAPIVLSMLLNTSDEIRQRIPSGIKAMTAGAAPPAAIIEKLEAIGADITHVYGLTETYGPAAFCDWNTDWDEQTLEDRATLKSRQGVTYLVQEAVDVFFPETMEPVPADGNTLGEIMFRGNITMKGYLKNHDATAEAFQGGWFHSGDLAVKHPDGYIEIRDRSKDIIISGGENISSVEVEGALYKHPDVVAAAVVAKPDDKWGEVPCAFVELKPGATVTEQALIDHCRKQLAHFKAPKAVVFGDLPKTTTGKIQKFALRKKLAQNTHKND